MDHLFRLVPPAHSAPLAVAVDHLLLETTQQLFSFELDAARAAQIQRRVGDGGLGLRRRGGPFASAAWLASWAQCYQGVFAGTAWELADDLGNAPAGSVAGLISRAATTLQDGGVHSAALFLDGEEREEPEAGPVVNASWTPPWKASP